MTDTTAAAPLTADEQALLASLQARVAAEKRAQEEAATNAVRDLVAAPEYQAAVAKVDAAHQVARTDVELTYLLDMMTRIAKRFPG